MDHDKLVEELTRLQNLLNTLEPTSEEYSVVADRMVKLAKLGIELDDACDKQLERQDKLDLERYKIDKEFEFKEKELELKNGIEAMKIEDNAADAAERRRTEKRQALWELIKIALQLGGSAALICVTGKIEQGVILGHNKWSLIPKPRI